MDFRRVRDCPEVFIGLLVVGECVYLLIYKDFLF